MQKHLCGALGTIALLLSVAPAAVAQQDRQQDRGKECTLAGTWYGGSVVAYHMTIIPTAEEDRYTVYAQGMYTDSALSTIYTGTLLRKGGNYEGSIMRLFSTNPIFATPPPPLGVMPDLTVGWVSMKLVDCNTISNVIPFFGVYFASGVWSGQKTPLIDPPDVDMLDVLNNGRPVNETYHRLPEKVNRVLLHQE